ncbi:hypothetical protein BGX27_007367 [Mortierella sp. AM989]|nr:hypothetical protein BGX27_007367 [Mortierella sp. AM989]
MRDSGKPNGGKDIDWIRAVNEAISNRSVLKLLKNLPNLDLLRVNQINGDLFFVKPGSILDYKPSNIKMLRVDEADDSMQTNIADGFLPWLPSTKINFLNPNLSVALSIHCKHLRSESISEPIDPTPHATQENLALGFLRSFVDLQVFNAICHEIQVEQLFEHPVSAPEYTGSLSDEEQDIIDERHCREQQHRVYSQLTKLTHLWILKLGEEIIDHRQVDRPLGHMCKVYDGLTLDTLELRLESSLDRLASLKNLGVFEFKGVHQKIGKPELEWIAKNWPKLRVMCGLQEDEQKRYGEEHMIYQSEKLEHDAGKAELQEYMQMLRPDIQRQKKLDRYQWDSRKSTGKASVGMQDEDQVYPRKFKQPGRGNDQISIASIGLQVGIHSHTVALRAWKQRGQLLAMAERLSHQAVNNISQLSKRPMMIVEEALTDWIQKERTLVM